MTKVKVINRSNNQLPYYATEKSSGMDIRAYIQGTDSLIINPNTRAIVGTGIYIELPDGYEAQVRPRSGLAAKHGITVLNSPGTIDADYTGEIKVILYNSGTVPFMVSSGDRIAQLVVAAYTKVSFNEVESLEETGRGAGGLGHTGVK